MGYSGKLEEKLLAQLLRRQGFSYNEILLQISVSKDTLSRWCKDIRLTANQQERLLKSKISGQKKGSLVAAANKRSKREVLLQNINRSSKNDVGDISLRDRFMLGIALYCGEGDKTDGKGAFTNSDPKLIRFMMRWFREFCLVPEDRFRGALWIHEGNHVESAERFWSQLTGISIDQFHKTYIAQNKLKSGKIRKQLHPYGVFSIRFSCTDIHRRIMGWISALFDDRILNTF